MRVKPTDPNAVLLDPVTRARLPVEGGEVPDNVYWRRRLIHGDVELVVVTETATPTGLDPVKPLTTR